MNRPTETSPARTVLLPNGVAMPSIGLGTWPMDDNEAEATVAQALRLGYRLIDTAENYRNERGVGKGIRASGVDPAEVFVTTKFNREWHGYHEVRRAWQNSADRLGVDRIDLLLIHWPNPSHGRYSEAWRGMIELLSEGKVRAIGVSNFKPAHIERLLAETGVAPHVNQVQLNPWVTRAEERAYHARHGIVTESWSPIGKGGELLREEAISRAAASHGRTPAQVVLRWHIQLGLVAIPKTSRPERLAENLAVFDFELSESEMNAISALDRHGQGAVDSDRIGH